MNRPLTPERQDSPPIALQAEMTVRALLRRRLTLAILVAMPVVFYFVTHDAVGRAVRSLAFGLSWAVSTVAFFAALSARQLEPRLLLVGWTSARLILGRIMGLAVVGVGLTALFGLLVAVDQDPQSLAGVVLDFAVTAAVAIGVGTAVGALVSREMEGTMVLFFFAGLQAVVNPFDAYSRALPFWSSRELGTYAIDGPDAGSLSEGLGHGAATLLVCALIVIVSGRWSSARRIV